MKWCRALEDYWLMDQFYDSIPFRRKTRMHFHHFMQFVHKELNKAFWTA